MIPQQQPRGTSGGAGCRPAWAGLLGRWAHLWGSKRVGLVVALLLCGFARPVFAAGSGAITLTVTLKQATPATLGVKVTAPPDQRGAPDQTLTYRFTVTNTGTAPDSYQLDTDASKQFRARLPGSDRIGPLAPGASATVSVEVTISRRARAGLQGRLTLTAISRTDRHVSDRASVTTTVAAPVHSKHR